GAGERIGALGPFERRADAVQNHCMHEGLLPDGSSFDQAGRGSQIRRGVVGEFEFPVTTRCGRAPKLARRADHQLKAAIAAKSIQADAPTTFRLRQTVSIFARRCPMLIGRISDNGAPLLTMASITFTKVTRM